MEYPYKIRLKFPLILFGAELLKKSQLLGFPGRPGQTSWRTPKSSSSSNLRFGRRRSARLAQDLQVLQGVFYCKALLE